MINFHNDETLKLIVDFHKVQYGIMDFTLSIGDKTFETNFSEAFDPIISFKHWLEAICIGVYQCSFWYDPEGTEIKFNFERDWHDNNTFTASCYYDDNEIYLTGKVKRRQLIEAFYLGLLKFRESLKFDEDQWEKHYLWEKVTKNLGISYEDLMDRYSRLNRTDLMNALFDVSPCYRQKETPIGEVIPLSVAIEEDFERIEWDVPAEYDTFANEDKKNFVEKCFQFSTGDMNGTKIADFKSEIIENFLNKAENS